MFGIFKGKNKEEEPKQKDLHFALIISDKSLGKAVFTIPSDCKFFLTTGTTVPDVVIPRTVMKEMVERFYKVEPTPLQGKVRISEKKV